MASPSPLRFLIRSATHPLLLWSFILFYLYIRWRSFLTYVAPPATVEHMDALLMQPHRQRQELHNFIQHHSQEFLNTPLSFAKRKP